MKKTRQPRSTATPAPISKSSEGLSNDTKSSNQRFLQSRKKAYLTAVTSQKEQEENSKG